MKYQVEYYFAETQTEEVEASSKDEAEKLMLDTLANQHAMCGRPTDIIYGVRSVQEVDEEEDEKENPDTGLENTENAG